MARRWIIAMTIVAVLGLFALAAVVMITQTDYGRERVRRVTLNLLQDKTRGLVRVGRITGNLLEGFTFTNVSIRDSAGGLFLMADEATAKYSIRGLLGKKLVLHDVKLVRPIIVLDKPPRGTWNFRRLYPTSTTPKDTNAAPGFGDWIRFENVEIVDGRMIVRSPWYPDSTLSPSRRDSLIADRLAGGSRTAIRQVPGGYQRVTDLKAIAAQIPLFRLKDPDDKTKRIEIATLQMAAAIFLPPVAEVRDLRGVIEFRSDSIWFNDLNLVMPGSRARISGKYEPKSEDLTLRVLAERVALSDLRWIYPRLPSDGGGSMDFSMLWRDTADTYLARNLTVARGSARATGDFGVTMGDSTTRFHDTDLRFSGVDTRLIEQLVPGFVAPRRGTLGGRTALDGTLANLRIDADVSFDDPLSGRSRVAARGDIGIGDSVFRARDLRVTLAPLQVDLAHKSLPDLPIGGTITGTATVNGSTATRLLAEGEVEHTDRGARSRLTGRAAIRLRGERWMDIALEASPLSLTTVGRFAPAIGLQGGASGPIRLTGTLRALDVNSTLRVADGGDIETRGRLDLQSAEKSYNLAVEMRLFNARSVIAKLPSTSLTAGVHANGRGLDPATMRATITADLATSSLDSVQVDTALARLTIADGLLRVDSLFARAPYGSVSIIGAFGLSEAQNAELAYRVVVDSLQALQRWLPSDSGTVAPRPAAIARAFEEARRDSARVYEQTELERAITGERAPRLVADTPSVVRRDSLAGSAVAAGTIRGSIKRFDVRGRAGATGLAYRGNTVADLRTEYAWLNARTPAAALIVGADMRQVSASGFLLDSVATRLTYASDSGTVAVMVHQDDQRDYSVKAQYALHANHKELHLDDLRLRFDTAFWTSTQPGAVKWGGSGIEIRTVELTNGAGGRIYVNGLLPTEGVADLEIAVDGFDIGNVMSLLQSDLKVTGIITLAARVRGTMMSPDIRGAAAATNLTWGGVTIPALKGTVEYADQRLTGYAELVRAGGAPMLVANGTLPVNLALKGVPGSRLPDGAVTLDIVADSMPLELIPQFTDAVSNVRGRAVGSVAIRGTMRQPSLAGALRVDGGQARVVPLGITVRRIAGSVRMTRDTVMIDSLVGDSDGSVRISGGLGMKTLTTPSFDLRLVATRARVMDNDLGRMRADAQLALYGPFAQAYVSGGIRVRSGVLWVPKSDDKKVISAGDPAVFSVIDTSLMTNREILPNQSPLLKNLRADVNVRVDRDTWVRSQDANVEIYSVGDLIVKVDRATDALTLDGVLNSDRGEYTFLSKRFRVKRGSATFIGSPELDPTLQLTGEYQVRLPAREALYIRLLIGGTLKSPRLTLESDAQPPIPQSDLLSYLAFGRTSSSLLQTEGSGASTAGTSGGLVGATAALATSQLAGVAVGVMANEVESDAARTLGADVFNITPADLQTELWQTDVGSFLLGTEIEYGKYWNPRNFVGLQARPLFFFQPSNSPPGLRYQHRDSRGFILEASFESRFRLRAPSLAITQPKTATVFGLFLIREWRF